MPSHASTSFSRYLLGNLRLSAIVCAIVVVGIVAYAIIAGESIAWEMAVFLAVGMVISSFINAWADARRSRRTPGG